MAAKTIKKVSPRKNPEPKYKRPTPRLSSLTAREITQRKNEIQAFLDKSRSQLEIVATTRTKSGQVLDWVRPESQLRSGTLASPPPLPQNRAPRRQAKPVPSELEFDKAARGPTGTVPIVKTIVRELRGSGSLQDFFSKHGQPRPQPQEVSNSGQSPQLAGNGHRYARSGQWVTCYGASGVINLWKPYVMWSSEFSLGQIALARGDSSPTVNTLQTIEAGWQLFPSKYNDWDAHLFTFYTTNNYLHQENFLGGYNEEFLGWVQQSSTWWPGARLSPTSIYAGVQREIDIQYKLYNGNWWLRFGSEWIGYYPAYLFSSIGLRSNASFISFFGEVVDDPYKPGPTTTDMGSGVLPSWIANTQRFGRVAYMRNLLYQSTAAGTMTRYSPQSWDSDSAFNYQIYADFANPNSWGSQCWWGGFGAL